MAVKIAPETDKVYNEINYLAKCNSHFVIGYFGSFVCGSEMWVITDYCGGGFVSDLIEEAKKSSDYYSWPEECIRAVCAGVVLGLDYLHDEGFIHRDIRCSSILVTNAGYIKLTRLGISAPLDEIARKPTVVGSPLWMAPEVTKEGYYDGRADVWSLGITTIEMAEGKPPHSSLQPAEAVFLTASNPGPTLADPDNWDQQMNQFISCCCKKDPAERTDSRTLASHIFVRSEVKKGRANSPLFPWHLIPKEQNGNT